MYAAPSRLAPGLRQTTGAGTSGDHPLSNDRHKRDSMSIEEATVSNMSEIMAIVKILERTGLLSKGK
jgi:hypothetical protein